MKLHVTHLTRFTYSQPVREEVMECRFGPFSDADQRWDRFELRVKPSASIRSYVDAFDNSGYLVTLVAPHETIELVTRSEVTTLLANPFEPLPTPPTPLTPSERFDYLSPSRLVGADPRLAEMAEPHRPAEPANEFDSAIALADLVHDSFIYQRGTTTTRTTVADVLDMKTGVCQDFAHVLIGLCRAVSLPARYVSGYVAGDALIHQPEQLPSASHAWAEIFTSTHGWRGFDPANHLLAGEQHVKVGVGRDYTDLPPTNGTFRGGASQSLTVEVAIQPHA